MVFATIVSCYYSVCRQVVVRGCLPNLVVENDRSHGIESTRLLSGEDDAKAFAVAAIPMLFQVVH